MRARPLVWIPLLVLFLLVSMAANCRGRGTEITPDPETAADSAERDRGRRVDRPPPDLETKDVTGGAFDQDRPVREEIPPPPDRFDRTGRLGTVYFAYDSEELTTTTLDTLRDNAEWLKAHPERTVAIEGHCDERGTIEYNLALGQRRANAVRDYLVNLGLRRDRMRVVTYGEERPAQPGHDESAWSQNRRAEFVLER